MEDIRSGYELICNEFLPSVCTANLYEDRDVIIVAPTKGEDLIYVTRKDVEERTPIELVTWLSERIRSSRHEQECS